MTPALRPFMSFYGGKWRAAPSYPPPRHSTIIEPFAGSAGYSLRYAGRNVVLVEKDAAIAALWKWLTKVRPSEILSLPNLEEGQSTDDLSVCAEAKTLIGFWCSAAVASPCKRVSAWGVKYRGGSQLFWGPRVRERVARQLDHIRHWRVIHGDYTKSPDIGATWFIDPPYQGPDGRHYRECNIDYSHLAEWCRSRPGQVIVCDQQGADWLPFKPHGEFKATCGKHKDSRTVPEALWVKPSPFADLLGRAR